MDRWRKPSYEPVLKKGVTSLSEKHSLFWGDLHNHNAVGYAKGSLERSIDIARKHLDFFAFTGHAHWHDMPLMPGERHLHWVRGFKAHREHWPKTRKLIREANDERFTAFLGYEWHSSIFGDYCLIFPEDQAELYLPDHVEMLFDFARKTGALAIPHHVAYKTGWRGINWNYFSPVITPVVEIFSEHGCTETDRAPYPMILHSNGGRQTSNTIDYQLGTGKRFGFLGSTDDHFGYPGAWGEGITGVWADGLSRKAIFEAIRSRRVYAVTGDRIRLEFTLNGSPMGAELPPVPKREIKVAIEGEEPVKMIELIKNGRVIRRYFPEDNCLNHDRFPERAKCRIQYGWGPWATLNLERICEWEMEITLNRGFFHGVNGCFQSGPFSEKLRDKLELKNEQTVKLSSFTSRKDAYLEDPTKSIVLDMEAPADAVLAVRLLKPSEKLVSTKLKSLLKDNVVEFTGVFTSESFIIGRICHPQEFTAVVEWEDEGETRAQAGADFYYIRVTQHNGQMAWSSPIWVETAASVAGEGIGKDRRPG